MRPRPLKHSTHTDTVRMPVPMKVISFLVCLVVGVDASFNVRRLNGKKLPVSAGGVSRTDSANSGLREPNVRKHKRTP